LLACAATERLEIFCRFIEDDFYVRAKSWIAMQLAAGWSWENIEKGLLDEVKNASGEYAKHSLVPDGSLEQPQWVAERITHSQPWHWLLKEIEQIRHAQLTGQELLVRVIDWTVAPLDRGSAGPAGNAARSGPNVGDRKTAKPRGRPRKHSDAWCEEMLRLRSAGKSNRDLAGLTYVTLDPTTQEARAVASMLAAYIKRRRQKNRDR
jgi:hypothetical protein